MPETFSMSNEFMKRLEQESKIYKIHKQDLYETL